MIEEIRKLVEDACKSDKNFFEYGAWTYHIVSVVNYSKILAEKLGADKEVVEIAALLHDYAGILNKDFYPEHHIHGARLAEEILIGYNYPKDKIECVKHCIYAHRGSQSTIPNPIVKTVYPQFHRTKFFDLCQILLK